jgi:hypothetical protein
MTAPNLTELERRVADLLHHRAEIAMSKTDTEKQYDALVAGAEPSGDRRRLAMAAGAAAAAAAVVLALVLAGLPGGSDRAETRVPASDRTAVDIARDFVQASAAYDIAAASQDLASDAQMQVWEDTDDVAHWRNGMTWGEAVGFTVLPKGCVRVGSYAFGTVARCRFDLHSLGSEHLGIGPFPDNYFDVVVEEGQIVVVDMNVPFETNGHNEQVWEPFVAWLEEEHPNDAAKMIMDNPDGSQSAAHSDEVLAMWDRYVDEWVASQQ